MNRGTLIQKRRKSLLALVFALLIPACANHQPAQPQNTTVPSQVPTFNLPSLLAQPYLVDIVELPYTSQLFLDVYSPSAEGPWPVVVIFHGSDETKNMTAYLSEKVAEQGAVVFTPTWRIKDQTHFYPGLEDAACAIRYARQKAVEFGGNPSSITAVGHSAGGSAAAILFLAPEGFEGDCLVNGGSSVPDTLVGLDGVYDFRKLVGEETWSKNPELWDSINPEYYLPTTYGKDDRIIFLLNSSVIDLKVMAENFYTSLSETGFDPILIDLPHVNHTSIIWPAPNEVIQSIAAAMRGMN